jgi:GTP cyclohydrolase IB
MMNLPDIQQTPPKVKIALNRVGISDLKIPIQIMSKDGSINRTSSTVSCYVDLDKNLKGINMSRLPQAIHKFQQDRLNSEKIKDIAENIRIISEANTCELTYSFDYYITKLSPVNKEPGVVHYPVSFTGIKSKDNYIFKFKVCVTATSLCPCSKEISEHGAHNQKCQIYITCQRKAENMIWIEDVINIAEQSASCEIFSVLKRPDEKWVTEHAYNNPKFVEDIARECYSQLIERRDIEKFKILVSSDESIHMHRAVAIIET